MDGLAAAIAAAWIMAVAPGWFVDRRAQQPKEARDDQATDFVLKDLKGDLFRLSDQKGKPALLIFSTTWCPSCREEIPHLKEFYARSARKGLIMVNIDIQESRDKVSRIAEQYELPYRVLIDENGDVAKTYGVHGVPTLILLDEEGMIAGGQRFLDPLLAKMLKG